jgi:hypothetical protein
VADERVQIEVGFDGQHIMIAKVSIADADRLDQAFRGGSTEVVTVEDEDGCYAVALGKVVYVKRFARSGRVGFGAG